MELIEYIEKYIGKIEYGWSLSDSSNSIQVVKITDQPFKDINTYLTLGVSNHVLELQSGKSVRQEFMFSAHKDFNSEQISSFLITFSEHVLETTKGLLRGEVIGPGEPLIKGVKSVGVYSSIPVFLTNLFMRIIIVLQL